jgi:hypothetical protein
MSVSAINYAPPVQAPTPQKVDRPNDGDSDDAGAQAAAPAPAAPAPGTGLVVNKTA